MSSTPPNPKTTTSDALPVQLYRFNLPSIAAVYCSPFAQGFSNSERQAVARAVLKHNAHLDGNHYHMRTSGGLHPSYIAFQPNPKSKERTITNEEFVDAASQDILDAITQQDRLDSGISVLIRCPGSAIGPKFSAERVAVDLYAKHSVRSSQSHTYSASMNAARLRASSHGNVVYGPPIISIGPHTDAVIDRFKLGDEVLPKICELVCSIRSSHWEAVFRSPKWDLTYEQAANLTSALRADLKVAPVPNTTAVQGPGRVRPTVTLSKEARAALTSRRRAKSELLRKALQDAWDKVEMTTQGIAVAHQHSVRRVMNDLHMGHSRLRFKHTKLSTWNAFCWKKCSIMKHKNSLVDAVSADGSIQVGKDALLNLVKDS
ncbi:hypothetical protein BU15DRAFT_81740 [Melanogaster broomeanus]|nr:hypothetical protein BU15DRAFT_81740 [Melanogaster broomeanus]